MHSPNKNFSDEVKQLKALYAQYKEQGLKDYFRFLEFKSISSEQAYKDEVIACSKWLIAYLKEIGFEVEVWETKGHPTIFATHLKAGPDQPTLLIYNHYDVQPIDPLELWMSPPFTPTIRDGEVYARGAQDDKGQCFYVLLALKALIESGVGLPINIKLCIEGEEECGSFGLSEILESKSKQLQADYLAVVDVGFDSLSKPAITLGLRGLVTMDVELTGSDTDFHSGLHGGIALNPNHCLVKLLSLLRDDKGKIVIPGFYDDVATLSDEARQNLMWDFDSEEYTQNFGALPNGGEIDFTPLERNWLRPTLEINGINGGYTGQGFKTVIPAKASAKISCRLVANQKPQVIGKLVKDYLKSHVPSGMQIAVHVHPGGGDPVMADVTSKAAKAFITAYSEVFGIPCQAVYHGASIPIVPKLSKVSNAEVVLVGLGLPKDCIHAPNEHFGIKRIEIGFLTVARALMHLKR